MVDATQPHAHHQNHRQLQRPRHVLHIQTLGQRGEPATSRFHQHGVRLRRQLLVMADNGIQRNLHSGLARGDMR